MEESLKRTRTSPRLILINEVQAIIKSYHTEAVLETPVAEVLRMLSTDVGKLLEGHPKTDKSDDDTTSAPKSNGTHFVGQSGDGKVMYLKRDKEGVYNTDSGVRETLVHIYSFRTEAGARYAASRPETLSQHPRVL